MGIFLAIILFVYAAPIITFVNPTPENNNVTANNWIYVNATITGGNTSFINWNNSLVGWWRMNNESGENESYVKDWSGNGYNGTVTGATYNSTGGKFGGGFQFDGDNDVINFGNVTGLSNFTLTTWFKSSDTASGYMTLFDYDYYSSGADDFLVFLAAGKPRFFGPAVSGSGSGATDWRDGQWHHLALTYNLTSAIFYIDGKKQGDTMSTLGTPVGSGELTRIGNRILDSAWDFNGSIDEIQLFNRDLTPSEINASYNSNTYRLYNNFTNLADGNYSIKAHSQNFSGDVNSTEIRYVTVYTKPAVSLNSPSDSLLTSNTSIDFNCSASINNNFYDLRNVTLYLNYSGNWEENGTNLFTGISNNTNFSRVFDSSDKNFVWNCYSCDNESNCGFVSSNRTLILDYTYPNITFISSPDNNSILNYDWIFVNASISDISRTSSFIDFDDSLKLWWRFNNETGENESYVKDWSGNGNNGTVVNAIYNSTGGKFGGGYVFNKTNYVIRAKKNPLGDLLSNPSLEPENEITISLWMKSTASNANPTFNYLIRKYYSITMTNSQLRVYLYNETGSNLPQTFQGGSIDDGNWHHIVFTYNGSKAISYLDGFQLYSQNFTGKILHNTDAFYAGVAQATYPQGFNGTLDDIMVFNRSLSSGEISSLYNSQQYNFLSNNFTSLSDENYNFTLYSQDSLGRVSSVSRANIEIWDDPRIVVNYPELNDTNIVSSPLLNITVSNYKGNPMNVTFYNASSGSLLCQNSSILNGSNVLCQWNNLTELTWHNLGINVTDGITTTVLNNSFYVGPRVEIKEFYDDRQMGVIFTGDDWDGAADYHAGFMVAANASRANGVVFSPGLNPGGRGTNVSFSPSQWQDIQNQVDWGYVTPVSHSTYHRWNENTINLEQAEEEVNKSWYFIIGNLTLPNTLTFNNTQYLLGYIVPWYEHNENVSYWFNQTGFLASRGRPFASGYTGGWGIWNDTYNFYEFDHYADLQSETLQTISNQFDYRYQSRLTFDIMSHPSSLNWGEGSSYYQILEYIGNRTDVWYAGLGEMFAYHVVEDRSLTTINITSDIDNLNKINLKINIFSAERNKWGLSYPITYEISVPTNWTNVTVYYKNTSDGTYVQMTKKDRTTVWNGIDAYRKDLDNDRVYVSKAFPQTSNDMYLSIHPPDTTPPSVSFSLSSSSVGVGDTITPSCTGTDTIDDNPTVISSTIDTSTSGAKTATCIATDYAGNSASSFVVYTVSRTTRGGTTTYSPSKTQLQEGYSKMFWGGYKVKFSVENESKIAEVKSISKSNEEVIININGSNYSVFVNNSVKIDSNTDGYYDLQIILNSITFFGVAKMEFKLIHEEIPAEEQEQQQSPSKSESEKGIFIKNWIWISGGVIFLIIIGIAIIKVLKKSKSKKKH